MLMQKHKISQNILEDMGAGPRVNHTLYSLRRSPKQNSRPQILNSGFSANRSVPHEYVWAHGG
jgi:hypothetical protein